MSQNDLLSRAISLIREAAAGKDRLLVALDGRCAAGKTTLALAIAAELNCPLIHMDHFFLRPEQRTPERLSAPGENIDHERFLMEALIPLREGVPFTYRRYLCHSARFGEPISITPGPVNLVEGSYACHPALRDFYDLRLFLTVDPATQISRIEARNGAADALVFARRWIPLEESYIASCGACECCVLLNGSKRTSNTP